MLKECQFGVLFSCTRIEALLFLFTPLKRMSSIRQDPTVIIADVRVSEFSSSFFFLIGFLIVSADFRIGFGDF